MLDRITLLGMIQILMTPPRTHVLLLSDQCQNKPKHHLQHLKQHPQQQTLQPTVPADTKGPPTPVHYLDLSLERIQREQSFDADIQKILTQMHEPLMHNFLLYNNLLYRLIDQKKSGTRKKLPYIPGSMIQMVLGAFHDHPLSGHFGV
ncbi:unnamed protein product [Adineta ricciae]|uniref:Integrase zinc-binding domain-containing protein n=1 Tax=Adineta ricciae TaxID=249248 RepID=A0A815KI10_ADIRI|nr:unnamed protein product [Adineta ricciae]CAF1413183.1 unnamed protein product [Adineta ricciae]